MVDRHLFFITMDGLHAENEQIHTVTHTVCSINSMFMFHRQRNFGKYYSVLFPSKMKKKNPWSIMIIHIQYISDRRELPF